MKGVVNFYAQVSRSLHVVFKQASGDGRIVYGGCLFPKTKSWVAIGTVGALPL